MAAWSDEDKKKLCEQYMERNPTPENTQDILEELAEVWDKSVNSCRIILSKEGVYVSKAKAAKPDAKAGDDKPKRVSKQDAIDALKATLESKGKEVDESIVDKLTGKAAVYFNDILSAE